MQLGYFIIRLAIFAVFEPAILLYVRRQEYDNVGVDFETLEFYEKPTRPSCWFVAIAMDLYLVEWLIVSIWKTDYFFANEFWFMANVVIIVLLIDCHFIFYEDVVKRTHNACVERNDIKLWRLADRYAREKDKKKIVDLKPAPE